MKGDKILLLNKNFITVKELSKATKKQPYQIRYAIKTGKLETSRVGWEIFIKTTSVPDEWWS